MAEARCFSRRAAPDNKPSARVPARPPLPGGPWRVSGGPAVVYNVSMKRIALMPSIVAVWVLAGCTGPAAPTGKPMVTDVKTLNWSGEGFSGRQLVSNHYSIYTTSANPSVLGYLPGFMEAAHTNYLAVTGLADKPVGRPLPMYMMGSRQEWAALTERIVGRQAKLYLSIEAGGYCYRGVCVFWDMGGTGGLATASHEGMHQFLYHRLKDHLPMWMEEGLATMAEGYEIDRQRVRFTPDRNVSRFSDLRRAIVQGWWIPLPKLLPMDGGDAVKLGFTEKTVGYYGQVWALGQFLRTDPDCRLGRSRLLADAEAGRLHKALKMTPEALKRLYRRGRLYNRTVSLPLLTHYISGDLPALEKRYRAFAEKLVRL
jgi:hypothetical protein